MIYTFEKKDIELQTCIESCKKLLQRVEGSINSKGFWSGDYKNWDDIVAVCNLESMLTLGVKLSEKWLVESSTSSFKSSLELVIKYLNGRMLIEKGRCIFGEDIWDLFRLMNAIKSFHLEKAFPKQKRFSSYCLRIINSMDFNTENRWNGSAIFAIALEYCRLNGLTSQQSAIIHKILSQRNKDGSWGPNDNPQLKVWHTSQVIKALAQANVNIDLHSALYAIEESITHPEFDKDYFLKNYYLSYAVIAYVCMGEYDNPVFKTIMKELRRQIELGQISDRGALSMVMEAFAYLLSHMYGKPQIVNSLLKAERIEEIENKNRQLNAQILKLEKKIQSQKRKDSFKHRVLSVLKWIIVTVVAAIISVLIRKLIP